MDLRQIVFHDNPHTIFPAFLTLSSYLSLQTTPSAIPITATLTVLLLYSRITFNTSQATRNTAVAASAIALGGTLARLPASIHALSSSSASVALLIATQLLISLFALLTVHIDNRVCMRLGGTWSQVTIFPALWATLWYGVSSISPIGRLSAWSSAEGGGLYSWATPFWGAIGADWIVAAWAVVLSQTIASWYMGPSDEEVPLIRPTNGHAHASNNPGSVTLSTRKLASFLVLLALPSFFFTNLPLASWETTTVTPLSVGCVLPPAARYKHHALTLDDYIAESRTVTNLARLILWPEGAVSFTSVEHRNESFEKIRKAVTGSYIGVSFEENFEPEDGWPEAKKRTGIAIISQWSKEPHLLYFKRNLVPLVETFPLIPGQSPPDIFTLNLEHPKDMTKTEWGGTRPIPLTASICLDFAHPYNFKDLSARPALILGPARTWDVSVGEAMWQQAKQRAEEMNSMVLWCDGGSGGVSGVGGRGFNDVNQVGEGSWVKTIPIQYPFESHSSAYAQSGRAAIVLSWVVVFAGTLGQGALVTSRGFRQGFRNRRRQIQQAPEGQLFFYRRSNYLFLVQVHKRLVGTATSTLKKTLPSRLVATLRGARQSSTTKSSSFGTFSRSLRKHSQHPTGASDSVCGDDFQLVSHEDIPQHYSIRIDQLDPNAFYGLEENNSALTIDSSIDTHPYRHAAGATSRPDLSSLTLNFPRPPTHLPSRVDVRLPQTSDQAGASTFLRPNGSAANILRFSPDLPASNTSIGHTTAPSSSEIANPLINRLKEFTRTVRNSFDGPSLNRPTSFLARLTKSKRQEPPAISVHANPSSAGLSHI